jgi:hypothetical protein
VSNNPLHDELLHFASDIRLDGGSMFDITASHSLSELRLSASSSASTWWRGLKPLPTLEN